jgi:formylglycine-generating enzyme required for sulfatase activity
MSDIEQRLQQLEDRFLDGEISEETFKELRERLLARKAGAGEAGHEGAVNIADSVVRGDIRQTTQAAGGANVGGGIHVNFGGRDGSRAEIAYEDFVMTVLECGGTVETARVRLEAHRRELGLSLVVARSIETACTDMHKPVAPPPSKPSEPAPGDERAIELPGGVELVLCWCPATTSAAWKAISGGEDFFWMGSPEGELGRYDGEMLHKVKLTQGFWMGKYPVTQRQWEAVAGDNPSHFKASGGDAPVENVSWDDIQSWLQKANRVAGRVGLRLPTEAEWEYACRAGTRSALNSGQDLVSEDGYCPHLDQVGWYDENSDYKTHPVGELSANAWGLHDMHGNVWEWCQDWYGDYSSGVSTNPTGASSGSSRVLRGGSWYVNARYCRAAYRDGLGPGGRSDVIGFRVVVR